MHLVNMSSPILCPRAEVLRGLLHRDPPGGGSTFLRAMMRPMLVVFRRGHTLATDGAGRAEPAPEAYLEGPCPLTRRSMVLAHTEFVSVLVMPSCWPSVFPMPAAELVGQRPLARMSRHPRS